MATSERRLSEVFVDCAGMAVGKQVPDHAGRIEAQRHELCVMRNGLIRRARSIDGASRATVALVCLAGITAARAAAAAERGYEAVAPMSGIEIGLAQAFTQPLGELRGNTNMLSVAHGGVALDLSLGLRLDSRWVTTASLQYYELFAERADGARGLMPGLAVRFHPSPYGETDLWIELGAGYRFLWENASPRVPSTMSHGLELARARIGVDVGRLPQLVVGPFIGADVNVFLFQSAGERRTVDDPRVSTFVVAGIQGRLELPSRPR